MPKITDIQPQKRNKERSSIFVDNEFFTGASNYIVLKYKLTIGIEIDLELLKEACLEDSLEKAKKYVIDYHLDKPEKIIREKLKWKEYEDEVIERVIDFLHNYNLINDLRYAKSFTHDALFIKQYGKQKIKYMLKSKGIKDKDIEKSLKLVNFDNEYEVGKKLLLSKSDKYRRKSKNKYDFYSKVRTYLYSRGFSGDVINELMYLLDEE